MRSFRKTASPVLLSTSAEASPALDVGDQEGGVFFPEAVSSTTNKGSGPCLVSEAGIRMPLGQAPGERLRPPRVFDLTANHPGTAFSSEQSTGPKPG